LPNSEVVGEKEEGEEDWVCLLLSGLFRIPLTKLAAVEEAVAVARYSRREQRQQRPCVAPRTT